MIIEVGDYWIDAALLAIIICIGIMFIALWWRSRKIRRRNKAISDTLGKTSAMPVAHTNPKIPRK
jgi:hypothetical protein